MTEGTGTGASKEDGDGYDDRTENLYPGVCVVTAPIGSGEAQVYTFLEILDAFTDVSLITANLPEDSHIREYDVINISETRHVDNILLAALGFALNQLRICRAIRRRDEDIVLFYGAIAYVLPILFAKLLGRTVVLEPRADVPLDLRIRWSERVPSPVARFLAGIVALLERVGYALSDAVVTYTPSMADELGLRRYEDKLYTDGARYVDVDEFRPRVPYDEREKVVGYLGRLEPNKRVDKLAEVASLLPEDVKFVFAGDGGMYGWLEEELVDEIESGKVEMTGWVNHDEVPGVLNRMKLLVMPSEPTEGLPTVILESLACGTPVYATPVSGVPDVVRDGETGFLMREKEPEAIAERVEEALDDGGMAKMSENARELAVEEYSFEAAVERYKKILEDVADG